MREFFNRVIGDFVGLTEAANKVEALSQQVQQLSDRISALEHENHQLRNEVEDQRRYGQEMERKANENAVNFQNAQEHAKALQETIVSADSRVTELTTQLNYEKEMSGNYVRERDEAHNSVKDYEVLTADLRQQLQEMTNERDGLQAIADERLKAITDLTATVSRVKAFLNPEPETVVEFPQYNVG